MPSAAARLWSQLGIEGSLDDQRLSDSSSWGKLKPGTKTTKDESLFPRLETA
jgi:methionyl-tRNA synthetase